MNNRPYILCYMMMTVDGRIDCPMLTKVSEGIGYDVIMKQLDAPTNLNGRETARLEIALPGTFEKGDSRPYGKEGFCKMREASGYEIVVDSRGTLLWPDDSDAEKPRLIIVSEQAPESYLGYLEQQHISWIVCGTERVDLARAVQILKAEFTVDRMMVTGGGTVNGAFLDAGLLDEVAILLGPAIDGRANMKAVFDGLPEGHEPVRLKLKGVTTYDDGAMLIRYTL